MNLIVIEEAGEFSLRDEDSKEILGRYQSHELAELARRDKFKAAGIRYTVNQDIIGNRWIVFDEFALPMRDAIAWYDSESEAKGHCDRLNNRGYQVIANRDAAWPFAVCFQKQVMSEHKTREEAQKSCDAFNGLSQSSLKEEREKQWGSNAKGCPRGWDRYRITTFLEIIGAKIDRGLQCVELLNRTVNDSSRADKLKEDGLDSLKDAENYLRACLEKIEKNPEYFQNVGLP